MSKDFILAINPGTTTTRCALFLLVDDDVKLFHEINMDLNEDRMEEFPSIASQFEFRAESVSTYVDNHVADGRLVACVGRGGMLTPVPSGVISVNDELVDFLLNNPIYHHASNLGAPLAHQLAEKHSVPSYIVDPVSVDELDLIARVSGFAEIPRFSFIHALNMRACGRRLARQLDKPFCEMRAVIAHLGAGFSIAPLLYGRLVDSSNRMEISPFTPERAGGLPPLPLVELCYSQKYTKSQLLTKLYGQGGVFGYLGTRDIRAVEQRIRCGDDDARLIFEAMLYQVAKAIGVMAAVADFQLDGVVLTGGLANSECVVEKITHRVARLAPVFIYPGSDECRALAEGAFRVITGREIPMQWPIETIGISY